MNQKASKLLKLAGKGVGGLAVVVGIFWAGRASYQKFGVASHARVVASEAIDWVGHPFESVQTKVEAVARALDDNERLRLENAHLKLRVESLQFDCHQKKAQVTTHQFEGKLDHATGSRVGRTLASINYQIPEQLSPDQLYVLGVSYLKGGEFEKAAAILSFLTNQEGNNAYKRPRDWLMAGVAWYRLDNFEAATPYLDKVIATAGKSEETQTYHAQALLWKALIAERTGKRMKAQFWMRELLDHYPYSREATWVNGRKTVQARHPAAHEEKHEGADPHHEAKRHHNEPAHHEEPAKTEEHQASHEAHAHAHH